MHFTLGLASSNVRKSLRIFAKTEPTCQTRLDIPALILPASSGMGAEARGAKALPLFGCPRFDEVGSLTYPSATS
jgi:hypothetical protein